jgi:hypothetical protein
MFGRLACQLVTEMAPRPIVTRRWRVLLGENGGFRVGTAVADCFAGNV